MTTTTTGKRHHGPGKFTLGAVRTGFALGGRLAPARTVERARRLFVTPFASSRARAERAQPDAEMREQVIEVNGRRIATYVWGDPATQPYALLVHGWSSFGLRYLPWVEPLRALGYALVAFDQPGHGKSDGRYCTMPDFVDTVRSVGRHHGHAALVIAHSLGGAAAALAQGETWHADKLILIAPAADPVAATQRFSQFVHLGEHLRGRLHASLEAMTGINIHDLQVHRHLPTLGQPGLIVHDMDDHDVPWSEGERYARHWCGARLLTTQGLGHHRVLDAPEVMEASLAFLRGDVVGERVVSSPNLPFGDG
ncbi:alpha/beta hydrolase [Dyella jiangningensis]|uniref:Alpha/beta hydrolase n=1 Tax=Dyella jiangningensis TaxID=1379159 RepID=A0A328P7A7_9GAMM|nr:alpha/beta hydrolase [Dyella jiangningensis]RAO77510.1 alpha/beta hydrolase [Dyella jiangningensis]